ncbi:MAG: hypothetical protein AAF438_15285 [Pseudomonadota bacterium]
MPFFRNLGKDLAEAGWAEKELSYAGEHRSAASNGSPGRHAVAL